MLVVNFSPFPDLYTERLQLRRITNADINEIFFLRNDPQMIQFLDRDPMPAVEDGYKWIQLIDKALDENEGITWAISLRDSPVLIGTICYWRLEKAHFRAEIGYALHTGHQGKGLMKEAMDVVLDYGFSKMHLHSVEANVNPKNEASIKLLKNSGFVQEGYFKENYYYNGKFLDSAIYSLLAPAR